MVVSGALSTLLNTARAAGDHTGRVGLVNGRLEEIDPSSRRVPNDGALAGLMDAQWSVFQQSQSKQDALANAPTAARRGHSLNIQA